MNRVTYFEFATADPEKTAAFYREVFGWQVQKWEGPQEYWLVTTGAEQTGGINGGLMLTGGDFTGTVNTIEVDDIDAALAKAVAHGGTVAMEKTTIPGVGYQACIRDSTGIMLGLHKLDHNAGK